MYSSNPPFLVLVQRSTKKSFPKKAMYLVFQLYTVKLNNGYDSNNRFPLVCGMTITDSANTAKLNEMNVMGH